MLATQLGKCYARTRQIRKAKQANQVFHEHAQQVLQPFVITPDARLPTPLKRLTWAHIPASAISRAPASSSAVSFARRHTMINPLWLAGKVSAICLDRLHTPHRTLSRTGKASHFRSEGSNAFYHLLPLWKAECDSVRVQPRLKEFEECRGLQGLFGCQNWCAP